MDQVGNRLDRLVIRFGRLCRLAGFRSAGFRRFGILRLLRLRGFRRLFDLGGAVVFLRSLQLLQPGDILLLCIGQRVIALPRTAQIPVQLREGFLRRFLRKRADLLNENVGNLRAVAVHDLLRVLLRGAGAKLRGGGICQRADAVAQRRIFYLILCALRLQIVRRLAVIRKQLLRSFQRRRLFFRNERLLFLGQRVIGGARRLERILLHLGHGRFAGGKSKIVNQRARDVRAVAAQRQNRAVLVRAGQQLGLCRLGQRLHGFSDLRVGGSVLRRPCFDRFRGLAVDGKEFLRRL